MARNPNLPRDELREQNVAESGEDAGFLRGFDNALVEWPCEPFERPHYTEGRFNHWDRAEVGFADLKKGRAVGAADDFLISCAGPEKQVEIRNIFFRRQRDETLIYRNRNFCDGEVADWRPG